MNPLVHGYAARWNDPFHIDGNPQLYAFLPGAFQLPGPTSPWSIPLIRQGKEDQVIGTTLDGSLKLADAEHGLFFEWRPPADALAWQTFEDVEAWRLNGVCIHLDGRWHCEPRFDRTKRETILTITEAAIRVITICDFGCVPGTGCKVRRPDDRQFRSIPTQRPDGKVVWSCASLGQYVSTRGDGVSALHPVT